MRSTYQLLIIIGLTLHGSMLCAQPREKNVNPVYIDKTGTFRWTKDNKEAAFFGVNYTTPFAHAYRAHKNSGINVEDAIRQDVYHLARLGLDAFRVHVWDTEISDVSGNLLNNEHLRLYDFLLAELKKRNIRTIITPIAFWGNGYPEQDENTPGFSRFYGRGKLTTNDSAIVAQENYLKQFFSHINPYTKLSYQDDPDIIAVEINNEPAHSGPKEGVTGYVNRLTAAIKSTGWKKPVFYNISQGPYYADAVAASHVDGFSFQWYPSGLVSGNTLQGNYLPHVDKYTIPFDTIPAFRNKGLMVYEFDAADILQSYMYPAMVRSFREAGMGWATQFAYDPLAMANVNTEYQTHYLNLAYTPSKAVSMLIASRVFHKLPRHKSYGTYPADSIFDVFRVSYKQALSEMNDEKEFIYSSSTTTQPVNPSRLLSVAGVGSSPVVRYDGSGAYFLDKLEDGVWRLEVMPDAIHIRDPFEKASPRKEVTHIEWRMNQMQLNLPALGNDFEIKAVNAGNSYTTAAVNQAFKISPGTYLVSRKGKQPTPGKYKAGVIGLTEFVAPASAKRPVSLYHVPFREISANQPITLRARVTGLESGSVSVIISPQGGRWRTLNMQAASSYEYELVVPEDLLQPGMFSYRMVVQQDNDYTLFPGGIKENPYAWDSYQLEAWNTFVASPGTQIDLFNPEHDRARTFPVWRRGFQVSYPAGELPNQLVLKLDAADLKGVDAMGLQHVFTGHVKGRLSGLNEYKTMVIRARSSKAQPVEATVTLVNIHGQAFSATITVTNQLQDIEVPLTDLKPGKSLLLPRPYPGFLPLTFHGGAGRFDLKESEKIELTTGYNFTAAEKESAFSLEVERIGLKK
ncbi:MAG: membrane or secreted protein [Cyclobacteriaceae bacterium]|nr:membrane or secreted protein [Cyclobacteriaceae bacterium]